MEELERLTERERRASQLVVLAFVGMLAYLVAGILFPGASFIGCPFHALTGYSCPGCGMTRSTAQFLQGDLLMSLRYHPFGAPFLLGFGVAALHHATRLWKGRQLDYPALRVWRRVQKRAWVGIALFLGLFGAIRLTLELTGFLTPM